MTQGAHTALELSTVLFFVVCCMSLYLFVMTLVSFSRNSISPGADAVVLNGQITWAVLASRLMRTLSFGEPHTILLDHSPNH